MQEMKDDTGSIPVQEDPLESTMATHSNSLAWEIPWAEKPGGLRPQNGKELDRTQHTHQVPGANFSLPFTH